MIRVTHAFAQNTWSRMVRIHADRYGRRINNTERTDMFHGGGAKSDVYNVYPFCNFWELHVGWSRLT